ncbi:hypothetical protein SAMN02799630_04990 [Paenibacillus sp. UNCCL117]|nr:hypothetical protein SAMN04488602_1233 [Paenibacillus sp. cl123]SFW62363.1 hypothetical protein SAMN02799630_04990 [Paenibacillus sp. UNCCL117]
MLNLSSKQFLTIVTFSTVIFVTGCYKASSSEPALPISKIVESSKETANWEIKVFPDTLRNGYYNVQIMYKGASPAKHVNIQIIDGFTVNMPEQEIKPNTVAANLQEIYVQSPDKAKFKLSWNSNHADHTELIEF